MLLPSFWTTSRGHLHYDRLRAEAQALSALHRPPVSLAEWRERSLALREALGHKLRLREEASPLEVCTHGEHRREGYSVIPISFQARPGIRVTGTLYRPDGPGPFPGVLNLHGHWMEGKLAGRVQLRGHLLAQSGFVVLTVDAAGAGERGCDGEAFEYHGGALAGGLLLAGDTLLGWQVRDNRRALDVLESLPYVDGARLGATGASGGGNQTMWLAALDERVKAAVPVVSVGSFEAYIGRTNCMCETLPGGLPLTEEWGVLGLIAPRPLLVLNSLHDQPAFGVEALSRTARVAQEVYELFGQRGAFDHRFIDQRHGYWPPMMEAMLGWMNYWLREAGPATPQMLPELAPLPEAELRIYNAQTRPPECDYEANRRLLMLEATAPEPEADTTARRKELAALAGWQRPAIVPELATREVLAGVEMALCYSSRGISVPVLVDAQAAGDLRILISPEGKQDAWVARQWAAALEQGATPVALDLPGTGELAWDEGKVPGACFHDTARATLWLGYTLAAEWAEVLYTLCAALRTRHPGRSVRLVARGEAALAALLLRALEPEAAASVEEHEVPAELDGPDTPSLAWIIPGLLPWGGLQGLRDATLS